MLVLLLLSGHIYALTRGVAVRLCNCHRLGVAVRSHLCPNTWGGCMFVYVGMLLLLSGYIYALTRGVVYVCVTVTVLLLLLLSGHIYALTRGVAVCLCNCHRVGVVVAVRSHLCPNTWGDCMFV